VPGIIRAYQLMVCHQDAEALYQIGAVTETQMQEFDKECLVPDPAPKANITRQAPTPVKAN